MISALFVCLKVLPTGEGALHRIVGGNNGVADRRALGCVHGEVQLRRFIGVEIVPCIVVVIPLRAAAAAGAAVEGNGRVSRTGCLVRDDENAGALGVVGGEHTAVSLVRVRCGVHIDGVISDGHDIRSGRLDVDPVAACVAAVDLLDVRLAALQHLEVEVRLGHDIGGV